LGAFAARGLRENETVWRKGFALFAFDKARAGAGNVWKGERDEFAVSAGTVFYKGMAGARALAALHAASLAGEDPFRDLAGHFCVALSTRDGLVLFNDLYGNCHVFANEEGTVVSNSFVAVARSLASRNVSRQGLCEYLTEGTTYGEETVLAGVRRLDSDYVYSLGHVPGRSPKANPFEALEAGLPFEDVVERVHLDLQAYAGLLRTHFGDGVAIGLSGGYDSRHLLALLRGAGVRPYLYVYGPPEAADVLLAKEIAQGEGFELHHVDKRCQGQVEPSSYAEIVGGQFHLHDGQGLYGAFGNGSDLATRLLRTDGAQLHINGSCGEQYRNIFQLPDRPMKASTFVRVRHNWADWSIFAPGLGRAEYSERLTAKILAAIGAPDDLLDRGQVEMIYPRIRARYRVAPCISVNNVHTSALAPFTEARFAVPATGIPLKYKDHGRLHAALIRRCDPALARYPSVYGHDFTGPVPLAARLRSLGIAHLSVPLEPIVRLARRYRQRPSGELPWYLSEPYRRAVLGDGPLAISEFVCLERIRGASMLSRALTVELLLRGSV